MYAGGQQLENKKDPNESSAQKKETEISKSRLDSEITKKENCHKCKRVKNVIWFTDNVFWNDITGDKRWWILCIDCFVYLAEREYKITGWRLLPEFPWKKIK
ncbi:MAG: hypothetical protein AABY22_06675 [Nanoarchaeota archaeon]